VIPPTGMYDSGHADLHVQRFQPVRNEMYPEVTHELAKERRELAGRSRNESWGRLCPFGPDAEGRRDADRV
ncbi:MAG: hypothetical protein WCA28_22525, partial [Bradyrhizobium sp.]